MLIIRPVYPDESFKRMEIRIRELILPLEPIYLCLDLLIWEYYEFKINENLVNFKTLQEDPDTCS